MLGAVAGHFSSSSSHLFGINILHLYGLIGTLYLNILKVLVIPLILSSIITGVAALGNTSSLGRIGAKTISFYLLSNLLAILTGLLLINISMPGATDGPLAGMEYLSTDNIPKTGLSTIIQTFLHIIPTNIVASAADNEMLGLIFFSLFFGFFMTKIRNKYKIILYDMWQAVFETIIQMTLWVLKITPYGVFALVAQTITTTGSSAFKPVLVFFITVVTALIFHMIITLSLLLKAAARVNPLKHLYAMFPVILTAFSTASSTATLPVTLETIERKIGISNSSASLVLALGITVNMNGTALYECAAALFIAQTYGIDLSLAQQGFIVFIALLTSIGVAGIPSASLLAINVILSTLGLPLEGMGLLVVTDRLLDMCRTAVNVYGNSCMAVIVGRLEGDKTSLS